MAPPTFESTYLFDSPVLADVSHEEYADLIDELGNLFGTRQWSLSWMQDHAGYIGLGFFKKREHIGTVDLRKRTVKIVKNDASASSGQIMGLLNERKSILNDVIISVEKYAKSQAKS